jgi:hypothetical protein
MATVVPTIGTLNTAAGATGAAPPVEPAAAPAPTAPVAEPVAAAPVEPAAPEFPSADDYGWDDWDGESLDDFDERVRPYLDKARDKWNASWEGRLAESAQKAKRFEDMYKAVTFGEEDPRISETSQELAKAQAYVKSLEQELRNSRQEMDRRADAESERYIAWMEDAYGERLQKNPEAAQASMDLLDLGTDDNYFQPHEAFEIAELGAEAIAAAKGFLEQGWPVKAISRVLKSEFKTKPPAAPAAAPVNESASLVAGATPPRKPQTPPRKTLSGRELVSDSGKMAIVEEVLKGLI